MYHKHSSRIWLAALGGLLALAALAVAWSAVIAYAQEQQEVIQSQPGAGEPTPQREHQGDTQAPAISFIDSPSSTCYRSSHLSDACYIEWSQLSVSASSSNYIISMTVTIDGRLRAYYSGFFQASMLVPPEMHTPGLQVSCGTVGVSGIPGMGSQYNFTIRARETGGLSAANYGAITCPAATYIQFLPITSK
jgi:hypothetical protein